MKGLIKITFLSVLMLLTTETNAKKIKDINGLKIPKGYKATYDEFTETIHIKQKNDVYADTHGKNVLDISFIVFNGRITDTIIDVEYFEPVNLLTTATTIFIKNENESMHKYYLEWGNSVYGTKVEPIQLALADVIEVYSVEKNKTMDEQLRDFLMDNLNADSEILVRYHGYEDFDKKVPKKYMDELASAVEFYKASLRGRY